MDKSRDGDHKAHTHTCRAGPYTLAAAQRDKKTQHFCKQPFQLRNRAFQAER